MISGVAAVFNRDTGIDVFTPVEQIYNVNQWIAEEADVELGCGFFFDTSYDFPCVVLWRVSVCSQEYAVRLSLSRRPYNQAHIDRKFSSRVSSRTLIQLLSTKIHIVSFSKRETIFSLRTGLKAYALVQCNDSMTLFRYSQFDRIVGTTLTPNHFYFAVQQASGGICIFRKEKKLTAADPSMRSNQVPNGSQMVRTTMLTIFNWNGPVHMNMSEGEAVLYSGAYAVPLPLQTGTPEWDKMFSCYPAHVTISLNQFSKHVSGPMYTHISDVRSAVFQAPDRIRVTTEQHRYVWSHPSGQLIDFQVLGTDREEKTNEEEENETPLQGGGGINQTPTQSSTAESTGRLSTLLNVSPTLAPSVLAQQVPEQRTIPRQEEDPRRTEVQDSADNEVSATIDGTELGQFRFIRPGNATRFDLSQNSGSNLLTSSSTRETEEPPTSTPETPNGRSHSAPEVSAETADVPDPAVSSLPSRHPTSLFHDLRRQRVLPNPTNTAPVPPTDGSVGIVHIDLRRSDGASNHNDSIAMEEKETGHPRNQEVKHGNRENKDPEKMTDEGPEDVSSNDEIIPTLYSVAVSSPSETVSSGTDSVSDFLASTTESSDSDDVSDSRDSHVLRDSEISNVHSRPHQDFTIQLENWNEMDELSVL